MPGELSASETPDLQDVLDALDDPDCRTIVETLDEPQTASDISAACEVPLSTCYRKLELLTDASLLEEHVEIRSDGQHTTRYAIGFEEVRIAVDDERSIDVEIKRQAEAPEERLSSLWSEVRKET